MKWSRRDLLLRSGVAVAGGNLTSRLQAQSDEGGANNLSGVWLEPFVDHLPIPRVLAPISRMAKLDKYRITMSEVRRKVHRDLPPSILWGFEGHSPGPTIAAEKDRAIEIEWLNRLPQKHRLCIDHSLGGAEKDVPEVRTTIHLHGGHVGADSDGYPDDWITPGGRQRTFYPNRQPAATLWYHDHSMGITRLNAMMGLAGFYLLRDPEESRLGLPSGRYDIPLMLQDRMFDAGGQLIYPVGPDPEAPWVPEFFGTHALVNGKIWPYLIVEPQLYRFRLLNASNSRIYRLSLLPQQLLTQIASDGGLLAHAVTRDSLLIAPGERVEVLIDFSNREGRHLTLVNDGPAPFPTGNNPGPRLVMQFRVQHPLRHPNRSSEVSQLAALSTINEKDAVRTRRHKLQENMAADGKLHQTLLNGLRFDDPVTEDPRNHSIEIWEMVNATMDAHPIHLHAVHFQLLDRTVFDTARYRRDSSVLLTGRRTPAQPGEDGWKDTVLCPPGQVTRIIVPFHGEPGRFVWHCHMLEHEDNEMMRPYDLRS